MSPLLQLNNASIHFGGIRALNQVNLILNPGEIVGLIGPNGAGKTTLVNAVTGVHQLTGGSIEYNGKTISKLRPDQIARLGIARTFQVVQPFAKMTLQGNVAAAALFAGQAESLADAQEKAIEHLEFCGLAPQAQQIAGTLTLAGRKKLELAKSLAMQPKLLFLDEVNAGLNSREADLSRELIRKIADQGTTVVLIEHLMKVVLRISDRIVVLHQGQLIADATPDEIVNDPEVIEAYLGTGYRARYTAEATV